MNAWLWILGYVVVGLLIAAYVVVRYSVMGDDTIGILGAGFIFTLVWPILVFGVVFTFVFSNLVALMRRFVGKGEK